jgi:phosphate transport system substrate-binding protein
MRRTSLRARRALIQLAPVIVVAALVGIAASDSGGSGEGRSRKRDRLAGTVAIDGTAAMRAILSRVAERFHRRHPLVRVTVGASGDENAIALFCAGEVDLAVVARRLGRAERRHCHAAGIRYLSTEVARERLALIVSDRNRFARCLALDQVRSIWRHGSPAESWAELDPAFPALPLEPVGWKPDAPPAILLAEAVSGPADPLLRGDYEVADDPKELGRRVAGSPAAIGFLPITQFERGSGVRPLAVDAGRGCVSPTAPAVEDGAYGALSRPMHMDVSVDSLKEPETRHFVREYLGDPQAVHASDAVLAVEPSQRVYRKFTRP